MRTFILLLACLLPQDAPDAPPKFTFTLEQGWSLTTDGESDFPDIQENDLQEGLNPRFKPPLTRPTFPYRDRDGKVRPQRGSTGKRASTTVRGPGRRTGKDPLKLEGSMELLADGACRFEFKRIEYWDHTQRYWIELQPDKIRTFELGNVAKWTGARSEWAARLEKFEAAFLEAYLKVLTPQKPAAAPDKLGLDGLAAAEPAWRLFVATSLEEQLVAMLLARLDGEQIDRTKWPAGASQYPPRVLALGRALIDRLLAQASGTFGPDPARARPGRTLKNEKWLGTELAVPSMRWTEGRAWAAERLKPLEDARARLRALTEESIRTGFGRSGYTDPDAWRSAIEDEAKALRKHYVPLSAERTGGIDDVLTARTGKTGSATYDFSEKVERRDGKVLSSDADVLGIVHDLEVVFFHSGQNQWKSSVVKFETWYKSKVKAN